jgi:hypothetical protein
MCVGKLDEGAIGLFNVTRVQTDVKIRADEIAHENRNLNIFYADLLTMSQSQPLYSHRDKNLCSKETKFPSPSG